jgi:hypothetical protein
VAAAALLRQQWCLGHCPSGRLYVVDVTIMMMLCVLSVFWHACTLSKVVHATTLTWYGASW